MLTFDIIEYRVTDAIEVDQSFAAHIDGINTRFVVGAIVT